MMSHGKSQVALGMVVAFLIGSLGTIGQSSADIERSRPETQGISSRAILSFIEQAEKEKR